MEFHHEVSSIGPTFGVTTTSAFLCLCFAAFLCSSTHAAPQSASASNGKPGAYIDIASWENRTAYPRFLIYKDQFRGNLDTNDSSNDDEGRHVISSFSKPSNSSRRNVNKSSSKNDSATEGFLSFLPEKDLIKPKIATETAESRSSIDVLSSLEQLLAERRNFDARHTVGLSGLNNKNSKKESVKTIITSEIFAPANHTKHIPRSATIHDKEIINFPKDTTNPCNRLQINPDEKDQVDSTEKSTNKTSASEETPASFEIDNRQNFPNANGKDTGSDLADEALLEPIRDAVPTVDLTMKIIHQSNWNDNNVVFSPLSIANVLSMLLLGADGVTFEELSMQLDKRETSLSAELPGWSLYRYHNAFKRLLEYLKNSSGSGVTLVSASELFVDKKFPVNEKFKHDLKKLYEAPVESFNFGKDGYIFMDRVNQWVREKTQNQIETILEEPPSSSTTLGVINAIYFKGPWEMPFSEKLTKWRDYRVQPNEKTKAQMMVNILTIPYVERSTYRMAAVPYMGNKTALFLILPKGNDGINDLKNVESGLTRQNLNESINLMKEVKLTLILPKLKFSSDGEMQKMLENIGLSSLFSPEKANFSSISPEGLHISRLLHRAVVEINEKGTEASAVTIGTADRIFDDPPIPFGCDKPFIFFIYHVPADTILFWGRIVRPEVKETK